MPKQPCPSSSVEMQWNKAQWNPSLHTPCILRRWSSLGKSASGRAGGGQEGRIQKYIWGTLRKEPQPAVSATGDQCSFPKIRMGRDLRLSRGVPPCFLCEARRASPAQSLLDYPRKGQCQSELGVSSQLGSARCGTHTL